MPVVSEAQRKLMHAAASRKGGVGGVSQSVGKEFAASDNGGKLPERRASKTMAEGKKKCWIKKSIKPENSGKVRDKVDAASKSMSKRKKLYDHPRS